MKWFAGSIMAALAGGACSFDGAVTLIDEDIPPDLCESWTPLHFDPCDLPDPLEKLDLHGDGSPWTYDTGDGTLTDASGTPTTPPNQVLDQGNDLSLRVISAKDVELADGAELRVTGSMPLLIAAFGEMMVAGTIDASSRQGGTAGPGADPQLCRDGLAALTGVDGDSGSGGGGGGGFQGNGSAGGEADLNHGGAGTKAGGVGGLPLEMLPVRVRGGCPGADSGVGNGLVGLGGAGGGAIHLSSFESISVSGVIHVGGAGGSGGPNATACGGGGGGSGGYLGLEAPQVDISNGTLAANGGGGGEATDLSSPAVDGENGQVGDTPALGGSDPSCGTNGGDGSAGSELNGGMVGPLDNCGGGGGGGGAGYVVVYSPNHTTQASTISPPLIVVVAEEE